MSSNEKTKCPRCDETITKDELNEHSGRFCARCHPRDHCFFAYVNVGNYNLLEPRAEQAMLHIQCKGAGNASCSFNPDDAPDIEGMTPLEVIEVFEEGRKRWFPKREKDANLIAYVREHENEIMRHWYLDERMKHREQIRKATLMLSFIEGELQELTTKAA